MENTGASPNVEVVLSVLLQGSMVTSQPGKVMLSSQQTQRGATVQSTSELSGSGKSHPAASASSQRLRREAPTGKRKESKSMF